MATLFGMALWLILRYFDRRVIKRRAQEAKAEEQRWRSAMNDRLRAVEDALELTPFVNFKPKRDA